MIHLSLWPKINNSLFIDKYIVTRNNILIALVALVATNSLLAIVQGRKIYESMVGQDGAGHSEKEGEKKKEKEGDEKSEGDDKAKAKDRKEFILYSDRPEMATYHILPKDQFVRPPICSIQDPKIRSGEVIQHFARNE